MNGSSGEGAADQLPLMPRTAVYGLFFLSGATALIFEIVWSRQFVTVFGSSTWAISVVLGAFMAGQGLGSWLFGKLADRQRRPLFIYALLQAGIGISALAIPPLLGVLRAGVPLIFDQISSFPLITLVRFGFSFLILCVPCTLMGGTLPALSRFTIRNPRFSGGGLSVLYGLNIVGASLGCWLAGFYLMQNYGLRATNWATVGMCLVIAMAAFLLEQRLGETGKVAPDTQPKPDEPETPAASGHRAWPAALLGLAFLSGFVGLACEVLWVRYLVLAIVPAQFRFAGILGVFLLSLGAGSLVYRALWQHRDQVRLLGIVELLLGIALPVTLAIGSQVLMVSPFEWLVQVLWGGSAPSHSLGYLLPTATVAAILVVGPVFLMGLIFPLVCSLYTRATGRVGRGVGTAYALNTLGSIAGSLAPVLVLIPLLGIEGSLMALALVTGSIGALILATRLPRMRVPRPAVGIGAVGVLIAAAVLLTPQGLGRRILRNRLRRDWWDFSFYREGRTATVSIQKDPLSDLQIAYVNRSKEVPTDYVSLKCFRQMGALGPLLHENPRKVLVIAVGAGVTTGTALQFPRVESVTGIEIIGEMREVCSRYGAYNYNMLDDEDFRMVIEDGRNYLLTTREKYPVIISDSTHPKNVDSWTLYTREFYQTAKSRLTEDGVFVQWLPTEGLTLEQYAIICKTLQSVFPHTSVWFTTGPMRDMTFVCNTVLVATRKPLSVDARALEARLNQPAVRDMLKPYNLHTLEGFLSQFLCGPQAVKTLGKGLPINTDNLPYTLAGSGYSRGLRCSCPVLSEAHEKVWPYLANTGEEEESRELQELLEESYRVKNHMLRRELGQAARTPDNPQARDLTRILNKAVRYCLKIARMYRRKGRSGDVEAWLNRATFAARFAGHQKLADRITNQPEQFLENSPEEWDLSGQSE